MPLLRSVVMMSSLRARRHFVPATIGFFETHFTDCSRRLISAWIFTGDAEVMLEEYLQSTMLLEDKDARSAYVKAGITLLGKLWQPAVVSASHQLHRLPPGLLYQVQDHSLPY